MPTPEEVIDDILSGMLIAPANMRRKVIKALDAAGYKILPEVPTREMARAGSCLAWAGMIDIFLER